MLMRRLGVRDMVRVAALTNPARLYLRPTPARAQSAKSIATAASAPSTARAIPSAAVAHEEGGAERDARDLATRNATQAVAGPYRRVGNVLIVSCVDHPFKHGWEVNRMLRELRLEFKGQTSIHPDIPEVRKRLWRVRHVVRIDVLDLDEAKALIGVPAHVRFSELNGQLPASFGRGGAVSSPVIRSKVRFMRLRRMRLRDVLHRDELEKRLLEERRRALMAAATPDSSPVST